MHHIALTRPEIEQLQGVMARLDAQAGGEWEDRRVHPRIDFSQPMWLNLPGEPGRPWVHVVSRNLSTSGLGVLTRHLFYVGQYLVIAHALNEYQPMLVLCRVCYCRPVSLGIMEVGLAFCAARPDRENTRVIPAEWLTQVLQQDWLTRQKLANA